MKLITFFILLMCVPEFAVAQELASNNSPIELNAFYTGSKFMAVPDPAGEIKQTGLSERGSIEDWREQMFKTIGMYFGPRQEDPPQVSRMLTNDEFDKQANEGRTVMRLVLKETLKFSKERVVEINRLVKALKYEVSTDKAAGEETGAEMKDIKTGDHKITDKIAGEAHSSRNAVVNNKVVLKTGLRVRIDSGKLGLVSETEARYGKASYFYKVNLDNQGDNSLGFRYVLGGNIYLQVERDFNHTMDPTATDKPNTNLVQLGCRF